MTTIENTQKFHFSHRAKQASSKHSCFFLCTRRCDITSCVRKSGLSIFRQAISSIFEFYESVYCKWHPNAFKATLKTRQTALLDLSRPRVSSNWRRNFNLLCQITDTKRRIISRYMMARKVTKLNFASVIVLIGQVFVRISAMLGVDGTQTD